MEIGNPILVAEITGTHALKGVLRVYSHAESEALFDKGRRMLLRRPDGGRQTVTVKWSRPHRQVRLICLEGVDRIEAAEALVGGELFIDRADLPPLENGTYYWQDLIGLAVETLDGTALGHIEGIIATGGHDVYVVTAGCPESRREVLIPALASVVREVDLAGGKMRVQLPEGLIDG